MPFPRPTDAARDGAKRGLLIAVAFSVVALVVVLIAGLNGRLAFSQLFATWLGSTAVYLVAGLIGGALFGWLAPLRTHYAGRFLTAYLIILVVYVGGAVALLPVLVADATATRARVASLAIAAVGLFVAHGFAVGARAR